MKDYGVFANLVAMAGCLASAAAAITLAFMKRSRWQPPEEALPAVASRFASLLAMIIIALLYVFAARIGLIPLAILTVAFFAITIICLTTAINTNIKYSFYYPLYSANIDGSGRVLGGDELTPEAARIREIRGLNEQQMFSDAQGDKDLVWTRASQASVNIRSTLSFIGLIGFGTCSLAAAAMLVVVFVATPGSG
jgi:hypothetical protein